MANKKITDFTALTAPASGDLAEVVDISDTTDAASGSSKQVTLANIITKAHGLSDGIPAVVSGAINTTSVLPTVTELNYVDGVTSAIQTQLDAKQPLDSDLTTIAGLTATTDNFMVATASAWASRTPTQARTQMGLGSIATQASSSVTITGGSITGITDLAIADGGTGASTATAGFDALSPMTTAGDLIYGGASGTRTRLGIGTGLQVLRTNAGATAPEWATVSSGGQSPYDAIVAATGGDYTTLGAALAAASAGWSIYVKEGTYTEGADVTSSLANLTIIGENRELSVIDMATFSLTFSGNGVRIANLGITVSTGRISMSGSRQIMRDWKLVNSGYTASGSGVINFSSAYGEMSGGYYQTTINTARSVPLIRFSNDQQRIFDNVFLINTESTSAAGLSIVNNVIFSNNRIESQANISAGLCVAVSGQNSIVSGNAFVGLGALAYGVKLNTADIQVTNNNFGISDGGLRCIYDASGGPNVISDNVLGPGGASTYGIFLDASSCVINGNYIENISATSSFGIYIESARDSNIISGNRITGNGTGIQINANTCDNNIVTGNNLLGNTAFLVDNGLTTNMRDNQGASTLLEKSYVLMKNTSGATINAGNVVTYKAVAAGNEVTTTTTASDNLVFGMAVAAISNNASGYIQVTGKTTLLTVDGTTDIAIGDFLTTFTGAGIARKAAAGTLGTTPGDLAFAIALEAYTTNDSSGVVDALLIKPIRL